MQKIIIASCAILASVAADPTNLAQRGGGRKANAALAQNQAATQTLAQT
jgi:hypothetical protein